MQTQEGRGFIFRAPDQAVDEKMKMIRRPMVGWLVGRFSSFACGFWLERQDREETYSFPPH